MPRGQLLRGEWLVETAARPGVVAADDEVRRAEVAADQRVPQRLARAGHAHRQRQQRQHRGAMRVARHDRLVAAHTRVVIDIARLGHSDHRMDEQARLGFLGGAQRELEMRAMQWVPCLEGNDPPPAKHRELCPQLRGSVTQVAIVVMHGGVHALEPAGNIVPLRLLQKMVDARMLGIGRAEDRFGLRPAVGLPYIGHLQRREHHAFRVAQAQPVAGAQPTRQLFGDVEGHRDRPQRAIRESHVAHDRLVVGARHEPAER